MNQTREQHRQALLQFLRSVQKAGMPVETLKDTDRLVASGLIDSLAILLMHGWRFPDHEARLAAIARGLGFSQVSVSHEVAPLIKLIPRGDTTVVDAYLSPILRRYVDRVAKGLDGAPLQFMQSNGGLTDAAAK